MGIALLPAAGAGGLKAVQRGVSSTAETVTITAVDTNKSFVRSFSTAASSSPSMSSYVAGGPYEGSISLSYLLNTGSTFAVASYGAYLTGSTTLVTTGPCRWEIVEFL